MTVDVGRLELTLLNLLSNGIKYSDPEKPERYVQVSADGGAADHCRILVRDNGIGIPAAALETIFARFTRAHGEREDLRGVDGIGLGLAIVQDCVRAMGGRVDVESTEGAGTLFTLTFPLHG